MKNNFYLAKVVAVLFFLCGCANNQSRYSSYLQEFTSNEIAYNNIIKYIKSKYIDISDRANLSRKIILKCEGKSIFNSSDDRFCDSSLETIMNKLNIQIIYIEKNICFANRNFDLVSFELLGRDISETVYYHYSLCENDNDDPFENNSINVIPLKKHWTLFVEKK